MLKFQFALDCRVDESEESIIKEVRRMYLFVLGSLTNKMRRFRVVHMSAFQTPT
jgi:hypothetical protein